MRKETCEGKEEEERVHGKEGIQGKETVVGKWKGKRQFIEKRYIRERDRRGEKTLKRGFLQKRENREKRWLWGKDVKR